MTIFFVVAFSTLLVSFMDSGDSLFFMVGQANGGDFDIKLTALNDNELYYNGNYNFNLDA